MISPSSQSTSLGDRRRAGIHPARLGLALILLLATAGAAAWLLAMFNWPSLLRGAAGIGAAFGGDWSFPAWTLRCWAQGGGVIVGVVGVGWLMLGLPAARRMLPGHAERLAFAPLAGGVVLSLATLAVGLVSAATAPMAALWLAAILAGAAGLICMTRAWRVGRARFSPRLFTESPLAALATALAAATLGLAILYAVAPAIESDELRYHLAALFEWKRAGRIHYLPHQAFSNFPMLGEMLFMLAMPGASPLQAGAAKLVHVFFLAVSMGMIALIARDLARPCPLANRRRGDAWVAVAAFATIPSVAVLAGWGFIDLFTVAYFLGFVRLAGRALTRPRRASGALIGLIAGGAVAVKYTMIPLLGVLGAAWLGLMATVPATRRRVARLAALAALMAALAGGPWLVRNACWTDNPVYPMANGVFHGGDWSPESAAFLAAKSGEKGYFGMARKLGREPAWARGASGRLLEFLSTPWTTTVAFDRFEAHPLGVAPLLMLLLAIGGGAIGSGRRGAARAARRRLGAWNIGAAILSWGFWFLTYQSNRMLLPTIALALALGGASLGRWRTVGTWAGRLAELLLAVAMATGFLLYLFLLGDAASPGAPRKADAIAVALGFQPPDLYLKRNLNYYPAAQWLNAQAKPGEGALLIGEHRTLYFGLPLVASDWFDAPQPLPLIRASADNGQLLDRLLKAGIVYVFDNEDELNRYREAYFRPRFSQAEYRRFEALMADPRLRLERPFGRPGAAGPIRVFRILPSATPAPAPSISSGQAGPLRGKVTMSAGTGASSRSTTETLVKEDFHMPVEVGLSAPPFTLTATDGTTVSLAALAGKPVVLYFYPKDMTPGCTQEACDFRDSSDALQRLGAVVLGVSPDSLDSHAKFTVAHALNFPLLADVNHSVCEAYGAWTEKDSGGQKSFGVTRSTFLIDKAGKIARAWRGVKVPGHVEEVLAALKELKN